MFDFMTQTTTGHLTAPPVLFLSNAFGAVREWDGMIDCLGPRGACQGFDRAAEWSGAIDVAPDGAHLVAHGPAAYDALCAAIERPGQVRSITLVDPDLIAGLPELSPCLQFRRHGTMIADAAGAAASGQPEQAAQRVIDWWMGRGTWSRTSARLQARFSRQVPAMVAHWTRQASAPLDVLDLADVAVPVRIITGRRAPADIRAMARLLKMVLPGLSTTVVKGAGTASHLTDPHVVGPEIAKFVVSSDADWQTSTRLAAAA